MAAHTAVGYLIAAGLSGAAQGERFGSAALGVALWVACLNGGTLAETRHGGEHCDEIVGTPSAYLELAETH